MTSTLTLLVLRFVFLAVLWLFVFAIVFALRSDFFGQRTRTIPADKQNVPQTPTTPPVPAGAASARAAGASPSAFTEAILSGGPGGSGGAAAPSASIPTRLVITEGAREGMEMPLGSGPITIGRSSESNVVIRDDYTSTHHARLELRPDGWIITDLDSTNGTFLNGQRVSAPLPVPERAPITIGTTTFELRR